MALNAAVFALTLSRLEFVCRNTRHLRILLFLVACLFITPTAAVEDPAIEKGMAWLAGSVLPDGGYGSSADSATEFQATAEALRTLLAWESDAISDVAGTLERLGEETYGGTEYRARRIVLLSRTGRGVSELLSDLLGNRNPNGGFGCDSEHRSTNLDTAYALEALHEIGESQSPAAAAAGEYLQSRQMADGAWTDTGGEPSVLVTASTRARSRCAL